MRVRGQTIADDGFEKNVAEKMPKVKWQEELGSPGSEVLPEKDDQLEASPDGRVREGISEKEIPFPPPPVREKEERPDVSSLIEDLQAELLTLGKAKRALELDLISDRKTIFRLTEENRELRTQVESLKKEIQRLKELETEALYLREENGDALEKIGALREELRSIRGALESAIKERDGLLARIHSLESQAEEREILRIRGKLKEREAFHFAEENRELRARLEGLLSENLDLERKYEEVKRSFLEIRESLALLRDSCKTNLYSLAENPE